VAKKTTRTTRPKRKPRADAPPENAVAVRMYCQGLGDCFLLSFHGPSGADPAHVLIDCGVFQGAPGAAEKLGRVAADVLAVTGGVVDLLIVTHEHWDHLSGFAYANEVFKGFTFKNVWLSWAEDPDDPDARALKAAIGKDRARLAAALGRAAALAADGDEATAARFEREAAAARAVLDFFGPGGDSAPGPAAAPAAAAPGRMDLGGTMDWVRRKVRRGDFCSPGECRPLPGFEAVKAYVLGPPRSLKSIRKEDPSRGQGYGLQAERVSLLGALEWEPGAGGGDAPPGPFDARHRVPPEHARDDPFFRDTYGFPDDPLGDAGTPWRRIDDEWLGGIGPLALRLDTGVNNTSLALAFELPGGATLIFPGDAQIGNWLSWGGLSFKDRDGKDLAVTTRSLLNRAVLYKVGHHGSHNATLKPGGLEEMTGASLVAMVPTDRAYAATKRPPDDGWKMPRAELLEALKGSTRGRILLADLPGKDALDGQAGEGLNPLDWKDFLERVAFSPEKFDADPDDLEPPRPLWLRYTVPL